MSFVNIRNFVRQQKIKGHTKENQKIVLHIIVDTIVDEEYGNDE